MLFQFYKKISVLAFIAVCVVVAGALVAAATFNRDSGRALVDYVPDGAVFWLWGNKTIFNTRAIAFLTIFAVDKPIVSELARRNEEFIIYSKDNLWYRIEAKGQSRGALNHSNNVFLDEQYRAGKNEVIGFVGESYLKEKLSMISGFLPQSSYYFTVDAAMSGNGVDFLLIPSEKAKSITTSFVPLPSPDASLLFALATKDAVLHTGARALVEGNIREYAAFEHPVTVSRTLPDGSNFRERVADPKIFVWREEPGGIHSIVVDEKALLRLANPQEVEQFFFPLKYYESRDMLLLGSNAEQLKTSARGFAGAENFMYLSFNNIGVFSLVDIIGKSAAFNWLQKEDIQSIMVKEEDGGILVGRVVYK